MGWRRLLGQNHIVSKRLIKERRLAILSALYLKKKICFR
jgi:hypothetical protein